LPRVVWIDFEDVFEYVEHQSRPSGIQRLAYETASAMVERSGAGAVRFLRHNAIGRTFYEVSWEDVRALFAQGSAAQQAGHTPARVVASADTAAVDAPPNLLRRGGRGLRRRLPADAWIPIRNVVVALIALAHHSWVLLKAVARFPVRLLRKAPSAPLAVVGPKLRQSRPEAAFQRGDILLALGSPWCCIDYAERVQQAKERHGIKFATLFYDLIPLRRPEWCDITLVKLFRRWFEANIGLCDMLFAISRASADDLEAYAIEHGITLRDRVLPVPIGSDFPDTSAQTAPMGHLPAPGTYVLFVSTIEARKNHLLAFRTWARLTRSMPSDQVPTLVFAGRVGWLVADLMHQLVNTNYLDGKVMIVHSPSDAELAALYRGCLFTFYPSLFEGWGLPVVEGLTFGKPCVSSNSTSLPEAGGDLARYFDPEDGHDAYRVIRAVLEDRPGLAEWEARVVREFRPVPWTATANGLLAPMDIPPRA